VQNGPPRGRRRSFRPPDRYSERKLYWFGLVAPLWGYLGPTASFERPGCRPVFRVKKRR